MRFVVQLDGVVFDPAEAFYKAHQLAAGEVGEICIKGPQVMEGYWQNPEETAEVMFPDGWFRTGDIGRVDEDGFFYIEDRKKDMILVSGFNVYPNEIEGVVAEIDGVVEAAAIGVADEKSGEIVKLFVVRNDESLTAEDIISYCRANLTGYKVPKQIEFRDDLPKTNVGKILRRALRDASVDPDEVGYVNAHGTGTLLNDKMESLALRRVFPDDASRPPLSSIKALTGHMMGAAGAVEATASLLALEHGVIPPTWNWEEADPDCDVDCVPNKPRASELRHVLSNSYAFGGNNASLLLSSPTTGSS